MCTRVVEEKIVKWDDHGLFLGGYHVVLVTHHPHGIVSLKVSDIHDFGIPAMVLDDQVEGSVYLYTTVVNRIKSNEQVDCTSLHDSLFFWEVICNRFADIVRLDRYRVGIVIISDETLNLLIPLFGQVEYIV